MPRIGWGVVVLFLLTRSAGAAEYPVLFVHGWCSDSDAWNDILDNLPRERFGEELVRYYQADHGGAAFKESPQSNSSRSFSIDFYDRTHATFDSRTVADIGINAKAEQLKAVIDQIKTVTRQPQVIIVAHSMGGLVSRTYIQGWGVTSSGRSIAYANDVAGLVTVDTPHAGSDLADIPVDFTPWDPVFRGCERAATVNKAEMVPGSALLNALNNQVMARPWPAGTRLDAIVSYYLDLPHLFGLRADTDGVVTRESQDIRTVSNYWATNQRVNAHLQGFFFVPSGERLHSFVLKSRVTSSRVESIVSEIDAATLSTIGGRVYNATNNQSISGATVEIVGAGLRTTTDGNGQYRLSGINATTFTTRYAHPAYRTLDFEYTFMPGTERLDLITGLVPAPTSSIYEGTWTGSGSGTSSGSTPAATELAFQVTGNQITLNYTWNISQLPPFPTSFVCPGRGTNAAVELSGASFAYAAGDDVYQVRITGTFTSPTAVSGTASFQRVGTSWPQCPSATVNWSGRKR